MKNLTKKSGFTLIELLVVVLIIGILAAIAVPQYQRTVEKSRAAEAFINLKNIVQKVQIYILENGDTNLNPQTDDLLTIIDAVPSGATGPVVVSNLKSWQTATFTYLPNSLSNLQARRRPEPFSYYIGANFSADWQSVSWWCQSSNATGESACKSLGGRLDSSSGSTKYYKIL